AGHAAVPAASARARAPFDPSGYWVSLITQNWRYRMVVPGRGEYADVPINMVAKRLADAWNPAADTAAGKQCEAYGAAVIMRNPERLHITWQDENTLRVETDEGMQTRLLHFKHEPSDASIVPSLQGYSAARWLQDTTVNTFGAPERMSKTDHYGSLAVNTDHLLPGLLRKNGVPYGAQTTMSEYWDLRTLSTEDQWLTVSTKVQDAEYLFRPYVYDSIFQKEPDGSKWHPSPCTLQF
ncbi:MAG: hypothetical protein ACREU2_00670, partial [Steroidobacteraceae bacterium]